MYSFKEFENILKENGFVTPIFGSSIFKNKEKHLRVKLTIDEGGVVAKIQAYDTCFRSPKTLQRELNRIFIQDVLDC